MTSPSTPSDLHVDTILVSIPVFPMEKSALTSFTYKGEGG